MGCVRRGKKQKQGPKTLSKEEATGVPSTSARVYSRLDQDSVQVETTVGKGSGKRFMLYGAILGLAAATAITQMHPHAAKDLKEIE